MQTLELVDTTDLSPRSMQIGKTQETGCIGIVHHQCIAVTIYLVGPNLPEFGMNDTMLNDGHAQRFQKVFTRSRKARVSDSPLAIS
jgi:hypothetical protein